MSTTPRIEKCRVPNCEVCAMHRRMKAAALRNPYLPRRVRVAPGQMRLDEKPEKIG